MKLGHSFFKMAFFAAVSSSLSLSTHASAQAWLKLTPLQQEALSPLAKEWETLGDKQQKRLLATTNRYPQLKPAEKRRFQARITEWSKLTPEQRNRAREKYAAFKKISPEKREEVKRMVLQSEAIKEQEMNYAPSYKDETPQYDDAK